MTARGWEVSERVRAGEILVFDGGYGTMLFAAGLANGACPELWNDTHAEVVRGIHKGYVDAGSQIVETNTFGGSRLKLNEYKLGERTRELNEKGARLARAVAPRGTYIAGSIGPTSRLPRDYALDEGVTDEEYVATFREQAEALAEGGVDLFAVETMMFPQEATAAVRACKEVTDLPVMATMFFQYEELHDRDRTMWGESPADVAASLLAAGADVVGMNCGRGPDPDEVLRFQGYKRGADVPSREVRALFDEAMGLGRRLMEPRAVVRWAPVTRREDDTLEAGGVALTIPAIERAWGPVAELAAAVCTIGGSLERRSAELWEARELPLAVMLDSVGSGAVESLAEYVNDVLCQEGIQRGVEVPNRVRPGYGAWDVAQQRELFRLCPAEAIGVHLNASW